jgi:hypothetical protein
MRAENRLLPDWFNRVRSGQIRLPRFQRYEVWGPGEVTSLLESVLRGLPAGATLILEVGDDEKFASRQMNGAPAPSERCNEHLLDGQQRLTALWKSLYALYDDRTYFVYYKNDEEHEGRQTSYIYGQARWWRDGVRHPVWCDDPREVHQRGYMPVSLLAPDSSIFREIRKWCDVATEADLAASRDLEDVILSLRDNVMQYNLPYLSLPAATPPDVALDVFIKLNTTSVKLSSFDIIVAKFEDETGQSLRQLASQLTNEVPQIERYLEPEEMILSVATMREDYAPTQANYQRLDLKRLSRQWPDLIAGVNWTLKLLEDEGIFDAARLPTIAVMPVLAALYAEVPAPLKPDSEGRELVRKYLWRAFLTRRYENSVASRSLQDLRGLRRVLSGHGDESAVPIFDEEQFPLPTVEELMLAGWPKRRDTFARGILAVALKAGGHDLADNERATANHVRLRDYHHLFPFALLTGDGQMPGSETYCALNCALLTWETNRILSAKEPLLYFRDGAKRSKVNPHAIRDRLVTHLIPVEELSVGGYSQIKDKDDRAEKIRVDYQNFLRARANMLLDPIHALCEGKNWPGDRLPAQDEVAAAG